jgi:2-polyprenyl-6-methoxyphenol hydroxylase-like FAD-dependent oxidoreductase
MKGSRLDVLPAELGLPRRAAVAVGDCVASVNPIYGQGMTMGILQARTLGEVLDRRRTSSSVMARAYIRAAAGVVATPWRFAVGADWLYPEMSGVRPAGTDVVNRYALRVQRVAQHDGHVRRVFAEVQHLVAPPAALLAPSVLARVLRGSRRAGRGEERTFQPV